MIMINAVLDACVLYSGSLRDFLLRLAEAGFYRPFWSEEIRGEWIHSLLQGRPDLKREKLERTCREMDFHFPNALVRGYEPIIPMLQLPDPKDRHVLAAAFHAKAKYIVTFNLKDFPELVLAPYQVKAILPDEFVMQVMRYSPKSFINTVARHRAVLMRPAKSADEYLRALEKQGLVETAAFLRKWEGEI